MARAEGVTCPSCGMVRAPTLAECPRCRASTAATSTDLGERALLADEPVPSLTSLPSRLALAAVPLLACVTLIVTTRSPHEAGRALSYTQLGWVSSAIALLVAALVAIGGTVLLWRLASRVAWNGQSASPIALGAMMIFGVAPLAAIPVYGGIERANTSGVEANPPQTADCRWTEARQQISERTGAVLHVTVHATCTLPSGESLEVDIGLESASEVQGERLLVPTWPGRHYGRLIALSAAEQAGPEEPGAIEPAPR